jgi:hypothetical protein
VEYSYNVRGDLLSDALGNYTYDLLGRVTSHPTEGSFSYLSNGKLERVTYPGQQGTEDYRYDSEGYSGELYYHYDALGNTALLTDAGGNPKASFIYDLHSGKLVDSWNPDDLVVINLEQGFNGTLSYRFPRNVDLRIPPKYYPVYEIPEWIRALTKIWINADGTPVFFPYISTYWIPSWNHWEDASYREPDPLGPITFIRYNPNEMRLNGGRGRHVRTIASWENYENCMHNCFAGENLGRITEKPSKNASDNWKSWMQKRKNIFRSLVEFLVFLLSTYAKEFIATLSLADLALKGLNFINKGIAFLIEYHLIPILISSWNNFLKIVGNLST